MAETGFDRPTLAALVTRTTGDLETRLVGEDATVPNTDLYVLARVLAGGFHSIHGFAEHAAQNVLVDCATGAILERHGDIWGVTRTAAVFGTGTLGFTATGAGTITEGDQFSRDVDLFVYVATATAAFVSGAVAVPVKAQLVGVDANAVTGVAVTAVQPIANLGSAGTVSAPGITDGLDEETEASQLARLLTRIRGAKGAGSTADDYVTEAQKTATVDRVFVTPNELGSGTVGVRFTVDADSGVATDAIPAAGIITTVQTALDAFRPVTAQVTVATLVAEVQAFTIAVTPDTTAIREAIARELNSLFIRDGSPGKAVGGGTIKNSVIREAISRATGEESHTMAVPAGDITLGDNGFPTLGVITWT